MISRETRQDRASEGRVLTRRDRPMIFSAPMVRALLEGRKTQTRRLIEPEPAGAPTGVGSTLVCSGGGFVRQVVGHFRPRWRRGDRLWVKETTRRAPDLWAYEADGAEVPWPGRQSMASWTRDVGAAMYLPRAASRLTLIVQNVRVERLQDISEEDAVAEGLIRLPASGRYVVNKGEQYAGLARHTARARYADLWADIHGPATWDANPWVAALTFRAIPQNIDSLPHPTGHRATDDLTTSPTSDLETRS